MVLAPPVPPCMLAGGMPCERPLDGTLPSIRNHLFMHGYRHRGREMVQCPWTGCFDRLRWMNIPRHIRSVHLGVRMACPNCRRSFTRTLGLAKHVSSKNCSLVSVSDLAYFKGASVTQRTVYINGLRPRGVLWHPIPSSRG